MRFGLFKEVCSVYAVPVHHRQFCRELRVNPLITTNGYEEVYDLKDNPTQLALANWLTKSLATYAQKGKDGLLQQYCREESYKLRLPADSPTVMAAAEKKLSGFIKRASYSTMRGIPITARVDKSKPRATAVTEAIMAFHAGKREEVAEFLATIIEAEDGGYSPETQAEVLDLIELDMPFEETLDILERLEMAKIPNLPEFIGVDPFFAEEMVDGEMCGGKDEENGIILDCEGKFVGILFWDEDVDANFDLHHSPRQEAVEERFVQSYFKRREDYRQETILRLAKALTAKHKGLEAYQAYCKVAFVELKERAKALAAQGVHINVNYQAKREGLDLAYVA